MTDRKQTAARQLGAFLATSLAEAFVPIDADLDAGVVCTEHHESGAIQVQILAVDPETGETMDEVLAERFLVVLEQAPGA